MVVSYVAGASYSGVTATTFTPALPTGWAAGDLHLIALSQGAQAVTYTAPTGYSTLDTGSANVDQSAVVFYRVLQAGDVARAITFASSRYAAQSVGFRGVDAAQPFGSHTVQSQAVSTTTATTLSATGAANDMAVLFACNVLAAVGGPQTVTTAPTGYTLATVTGTNPIIQGATSVRQDTVAAYYKANPGTETPSVVWSLSATHRNFLAVLRAPGSPLAARTARTSRWR